MFFTVFTIVCTTTYYFVQFVLFIVTMFYSIAFCEALHNYYNKLHIYMVGEFQHEAIAKPISAVCGIRLKRYQHLCTRLLFT